MQDKKKHLRVLDFYIRLINGGVINKAKEVKRFGVAPRSIQRDIDALRCYFADNTAAGESNAELIYDRKKKGYHLVGGDNNVLTNSEILAVCKILLESRAFTKDEMSPIINKLLARCVPPENQRKVRDLISNELFHYTELNHHKSFVKSLWDIGNAVHNHLCMEITYTKQDGTGVKRIIHPVGIMFSEFYFYLTAFIENIDKEKEFDNKDDIFPTIYRIDRIQDFKVLDRHFDIPYKDRFEEGEFRKRIQFMYGGRLRHIRLLYKGINPEFILDRLPTARIIEKNDEGFVITAEVFGDGVDMWIRSQGDKLQLL
ncbi:MAG: WYL domain-containing protein [Oscillospiraceae bacterium]|nr:WYL domain-containing protein [Oscillospiraceae bacterium]